MFFCFKGDAVRMVVEKDYLQITLNRPRVKNAIDFEVMDTLEQAIEQVKKDVRIKALVITGAGDVFCSGGDLRVFHLLDNQQDAFQMLSRMGSVLYKLVTLEKPVFAFLNGPAVGGGLELAAACDLRYVKKGTTMGFIQIHQGITTGWGGGTILLEKVPQAIGMKWLMSGLRFSAEEARSYGFINGIMSEVDDEAIKLVVEPVIKSNLEALMAYKKIAIRKIEASDLQNRIQDEIKRCSELWVMPDHVKAVERFINRA